MFPAKSQPRAPDQSLPSWTRSTKILNMNIRNHVRRYARDIRQKEYDQPYQTIRYAICYSIECYKILCLGSLEVKKFVYRIFIESIFLNQMTWNRNKYFDMI